MNTQKILSLNVDFSQTATLTAEQIKPHIERFAKDNNIEPPRIEAIQGQVESVLCFKEQWNNLQGLIATAGPNQVNFRFDYT